MVDICIYVEERSSYIINNNIKNLMANSFKKET